METDRVHGSIQRGPSVISVSQAHLAELIYINE